MLEPTLMAKLFLFAVMFSANVVDGLVHQLGGWRLAYELKPFGSIREGQAVLSGAGSEELKEQFLQIIHTVPPFYNQTENNLLRDCYEECFNIAESLENVHLINQEDGIRIACPLLGAGCRGFPVEEAIHLAAESVSEWSKLEHASSKQITIAFGIPSGEIRKQFQHSLTSY